MHTSYCWLLRVLIGDSDGTGVALAAQNATACLAGRYSATVGATACVPVLLATLLSSRGRQSATWYQPVIILKTH